MEIAKLTSKHQITIPSAVRRSLGLKHGDCLAFDPTPDGALQVRKAARKLSDGAAVAFLSAKTTVVSPGDMDVAIQKGIRESHLHRRG